MPERFPDRIARALRAGPYALPVLALLTVYAGVLYRRALVVGVLSDGWVLLEVGSLGFRKAPFVVLSYHTIPVANVFMAVLWKLFGLAEKWYQVVNLAGMLLVGWLVYLLGCVLFRQPRIAFLASLLFLANSSFYEIPFWPTVGNFQSLASLIYLGGLFAVHRAFRSSRPWPWLPLFSLCGLAAFFTYEPTLSIFGAGVLLVLLAGEDVSWRDRLRRALATAAWSLPAVAVILGSKLYTSRLGYAAALFPTDWASVKQRIYLLVRGCIGIFSLLGADHKLYKILTFGLAPPGGSPLYMVAIAAWILGLAVAGLLLLRRSRSAAARFLVLWFAGHMLLVSVGSGIVSRHFYIGAMPAALISAWLIWSAADRAAAWLARRDSRIVEPRAAATLAFLVLTLLVSGAKSDLDMAAAVHRDATMASRQVVEAVRQRLAVSPAAATPRVVLVNMPASMGLNGIGAFAFVNGLHPMLKLTTGGRITQPELFYTYATFAEGKYAKGSLPISLGDLARRVREPGTLVLIYDPQSRSVKEASRATWRVPEEYDADSAPFLEWKPGSWPWFRVYAGQPLELPLGAAPERTWVALRYLRKPGAAFRVTDGVGPGLDVRVPADAPLSWPFATFPLGEPRPEAVTIQPETEVWLGGVWPFSPPPSYSPESAPFLPWDTRSDPQLVLTAPLRLPLSVSACASPCGVRIEYLAERGRDFALTVGAVTKALSFDHLVRPEWRSEAFSSSGEAVVTIEPRPGAQILIRRLELEAGALQGSDR